MPTVTESPAASHRGGSSPAATPAGVPVVISMPTSRVNAADRCSIIWAQVKIMSAVVPSWRSSPFTQVRRARSWGSPTSSAVTIAGPVGPWVSKPFPIIMVGVRHCQSRTLTSLTTVKPATTSRARARRERAGSGVR